MRQTSTTAQTRTAMHDFENLHQPMPDQSLARPLLSDSTTMHEEVMTIQASRLRELALSDSGFVFDPMTGHTFSVNPSGLEILRWLKDGVATDEIARRLAETFEVAPGEDPARDVQDFLMQIRECGFVK